MKLYFVMLFSLMAVFFLTIGVGVIVRKKPVFLSARIFFVFMVLCFSPQFANVMQVLGSNTVNHAGFILYLSPIMTVAMLVFFWIQMKGYIAIGIYDDSFRDSLHYSLNKNGLPFEEQLSTIKLTSIGADLQVAIQSWIGTGQIKLKKSSEENLLSKIIDEVKQYYLINEIKVNKITAIFYIIMGIFMLVFGGVFSSLNW